MTSASAGAMEESDKTHAAAMAGRQPDIELMKRPCPLRISGHGPFRAMPAVFFRHVAGFRSGL
jgi:hypothetical protein